MTRLYYLSHINTILMRPNKSKCTGLRSPTVKNI